MIHSHIKVSIKVLIGTLYDSLPYKSIDKGIDRNII